MTHPSLHFHYNPLFVPPMGMLQGAVSKIIQSSASVLFIFLKNVSVAALNRHGHDGLQPLAAKRLLLIYFSTIVQKQVTTGLSEKKKKTTQCGCTNSRPSRDEGSLFPA